MQDDFQLDDLDNIENFRINPHVWLQTLLAIVGDKDKKAEVVEVIAQKTELPAERVELILSTTIGILINDTRSN